MTKEQILTEAMSLDAADREALAEQLLPNIDHAEAEAIDTAWLQEVRSRDAMLAAGTMKSSSVDEVVNRILSRNRH